MSKTETVSAKLIKLTVEYGTACFNVGRLREFIGGCEDNEECLRRNRELTEVENKASRLLLRIRHIVDAAELSDDT